MYLQYANILCFLNRVLCIILGSGNKRLGQKANDNIGGPLYRGYWVHFMMIVLLNVANIQPCTGGCACAIALSIECCAQETRENCIGSRGCSSICLVTHRKVQYVVVGLPPSMRTMVLGAHCIRCGLSAAAALRN